MERMIQNKIVVCTMIFTIAFLALSPCLVHADTGPKPSVKITFTNLDDQPCYGTLLSERESTGPATAWNGEESAAYCHPGDEDYEIWKAFTEYKDASGYYFLQWFWRCDETKTLEWGYYPPTPFKILLYFPESNSYAVSERLERYAFDSYFEAEISLDGTIGVENLSVEKSYDYSKEIGSLIARILITIAIELFIAWLLGYRGKKAVLILLVVNTLTNVALNIALNWSVYQNGTFGLWIKYLFYEVLVFVVEAILYSKLLPRTTQKVSPTAYAFLANVCSFVAGLLLMFVIPALF